MTINIEHYLTRQLKATDVKVLEAVQSLWSGYGQLLRYQCQGCEFDSVIVKLIQPPAQSEHPRGWNTDLGHRRKVLSYQIEANWYQFWVNKINRKVQTVCRVANFLAYQQNRQGSILVLEDLNQAGFTERYNQLSMPQVKNCLRWLANFHAHFLGESPEGLWPIGTYWHLDTRPEEYEKMAEGPLKQLAHAIDAQLNNAKYQTIVHGDAKLANFCFAKHSKSVAAVDFQYVGGGCGMKDVIYFMSSVFNESQCAEHEPAILEYYFSELEAALKSKNTNIDFNAVKTEWLTLYPFAWADFYRFLMGWSPAHKKLHGYGYAQVDCVKRLLSNL